MNTFKFWKMHGAGNDFIVVPDMLNRFPVSDAIAIRALCQCHDGIGSEGLIVLRPIGLPRPNGAQRLVLRMLFFNPDGGSAGMCGNGARCAAMLAFQLGLTPRKLTLITDAGKVRCEVIDDDSVRVWLPMPREWRMHLELTAGGRRLICHHVNTGVPHVVVMVRNIKRVNLRKLGASIRFDPMFAPDGVNVNFCQADADGLLHVRTYERGVEDETGACGTGIVATALIAGKLGLTTPPVQAFCAHGDRLLVDFRLTPAGARDVSLAGPAQIVFEGRVRNSYRSRLNP